jgi:hypothetical protein
VIGAGERVPDVAVWLTTRDPTSTAALGDGRPFLLLFYLYDWSST